MKSPSIWKLNSIVGYAMTGHNHTEIEPGMWVPARPVETSSVKHRLKCAWLAFTGKCDLVEWPEQ